MGGECSVLSNCLSFSAFRRELSLFPVRLSRCHLCLSLLSSDSSHLSILLLYLPWSIERESFWTPWSCYWEGWTSASHRGLRLRKTVRYLSFWKGPVYSVNAVKTSAMLVYSWCPGPLRSTGSPGFPLPLPGPSCVSSADRARAILLRRPELTTAQIKGHSLRRGRGAQQAHTQQNSGHTGLFGGSSREIQGEEMNATSTHNSFRMWESQGID